MNATWSLLTLPPVSLPSAVASSWLPWPFPGKAGFSSTVLFPQCISAKGSSPRGGGHGLPAFINRTPPLLIKWGSYAWNTQCHFPRTDPQGCPPDGHPELFWLWLWPQSVFSPRVPSLLRTSSDCIPEGSWAISVTLSTNLPKVAWECLSKGIGLTS
jgi:hypothetical protein